MVHQTCWVGRHGRVQQVTHVHNQAAELQPASSWTNILHEGDGAKPNAKLDLRAALCAHPKWVGAAWARMAGCSCSDPQKPSGCPGGESEPGPFGPLGAPRRGWPLSRLQHTPATLQQTQHHWGICLLQRQTEQCGITQTSATLSQTYKLISCRIHTLACWATGITVSCEAAPSLAVSVGALQLAGGLALNTEHDRHILVILQPTCQARRMLLKVNTTPFIHLIKMNMKLDSRTWATYRAQDVMPAEQRVTVLRQGWKAVLAAE